MWEECEKSPWFVIQSVSDNTNSKRIRGNRHLRSWRMQKRSKIKRVKRKRKKALLRVHNRTHSNKKTSHQKFFFWELGKTRRLVVRAGSLDVTGLLALVANTLTTSLSSAVTGDVTDLATVVALLTLSAVTGHVAESTARVAGLGTTTVAAAVATTVATTLGAVTSNVSDLAALVALLTTGGTVATGSTTLRALTRQVTGHTAAVASTLLGGLRAVTVDVTLATTVVAGGSTLLGAILSLVGCVTAYEKKNVSQKKTSCDGRTRRELKPEKKRYRKIKRMV